jgi:hypothetical protein
VLDVCETARSSNERITTSPPKFEISSVVPPSRNNVVRQSRGCGAIDGEMEKTKDEWGGVILLSGEEEDERETRSGDKGGNVKGWRGREKETDGRSVQACPNWGVLQGFRPGRWVVCVCLNAIN